MAFTCQPQLKDLPREAQIEVTCATCGKHWAESVRDLVEGRRLGAQYMDLLEFGTRCSDALCGGRVVFEYDGKPEVAPVGVVGVQRPRFERPPSYPVKAVVKPRQQPLPQGARPQFMLPMPMPRTVQPVRASGRY